MLFYDPVVLAARGRSKRAGKPGTGNEIPEPPAPRFQRLASAEFRSLPPFFRLDQFCHGLLDSLRVTD